MNETEFRLNPGEKYLYSDKHIVYNTPRSVSPKEIKWEKTGERTIELTDKTPIVMKVVNNLSYDVVLRAGEYMETEPMTVPPGNNNGNGYDNKIYTDSPQFTINSNYLVRTQYKTVNNIIYVTIY